MSKQRHYRVALVIVWLLIIGYGVFFSAYSIQRHRAFLTHASDLGQIDQAIWNSLQGRLLEHTKATGVQNIRLSDHVEPLFVPISLVFLVYDNVEALLILQSFVIALGALPVFWIAYRRFAIIGKSNEFASEPQFKQEPPRREGRKEKNKQISLRSWRLGGSIPSLWPEIAGIVFAIIYLLFPSLEAANLAEFHAVTLAPALLLFAYRYGTEKAWARFALFALLALMTQEGISLLVLFLAGWFTVADFRLQISDFRISNFEFRIQNLRNLLVRFLGYLKTAPRLPFVLAVLAFVWFGLTYFVIIPQFNALGRSPYTCRYVVSEDCRTAVRGLFLEQRLGYLGGLFASAGWFALLDPLGLLLGLPMIVANTISNYPGQYSGTFHYSAPVAPYFVLAAINGSTRAIAWLKRRWANYPTIALSNYRTISLTYSHTHILILLPVLLLALAYHLTAGYTPIGKASSWPVVDAHDQLFARFAAEIPPDAKVSTTASLNPHLSHRQFLYRYPVINDAEYVMLDVNESVNTHPTDFRVAYDNLTRNQNFNPVDAADGYILLKRNAPQKELPLEFYSAFRANGQQPQHPTAIDFGDLIRLVGYDVLTDQYGRISVQFYWQRLKEMDKGYYLYPFFGDAEGQVREDITFPLPVIYWYSTAIWQPDETVVSRTVPQDVGPHARLGLGVVDGASWDEQDKRLPVHVSEPANLPIFEEGTWVELPLDTSR